MKFISKYSLYLFIIIFIHIAYFSVSQKFAYPDDDDIYTEFCHNLEKHNYEALSQYQYLKQDLEKELPLWQFSVIEAKIILLHRDLSNEGESVRDPSIAYCDLDSKWMITCDCLRIIEAEKKFIIAKKNAPLSNRSLLDEEIKELHPTVEDCYKNWRQLKSKPTKPKLSKNDEEKIKLLNEDIISLFNKIKNREVRNPLYDNSYKYISNMRDSLNQILNIPFANTIIDVQWLEGMTTYYEVLYDISVDKKKCTSGGITISCSCYKLNISENKLNNVLESLSYIDDIINKREKYYDSYGEYPMYNEVPYEQYEKKQEIEYIIYRSIPDLINDLGCNKKKHLNSN